MKLSTAGARRLPFDVLTLAAALTLAGSSSGCGSAPAGGAPGASGPSAAGGTAPAAGGGGGTGGSRAGAGATGGGQEPATGGQAGGAAGAGGAGASVDAQPEPTAPDGGGPGPGAAPPADPGATVCINADGPGGQDTYALLESVFGGNCIEHPDGDHTPPFRHIQEDTDAEVGHHFAFHVHQNDSDRGTNNGKNRLEIKVHTGAADTLKGTAGETVTYTWRFKMDAGMVYSPRFNAMFQLKSFGGNEQLPLINIKVAPSGGSDKLIVEYIGDAGGAVRALTTAPLTDARGVWLEVVCRVEYQDSGSVFVTIKRPDGSTVLSVDEKGLDMWRQGSYVRPKWGLYRGISPNTRDLEIVRFANFAITPGPTPTTDCKPR